MLELVICNGPPSGEGRNRFNLILYKLTRVNRKIKLAFANGSLEQSNWSSE